MGLRKPKEIEYLSKNASPQEVTEKMFEVASEFLNVYHRDINNLRKTLKNVKKLTILLTVLVFFLFFLTLKNELLALLNWYLNQISSSIPYLSADFKLQILFVAPISSLLGALILPKIKNFYKDKNKK